VARIKWRGSRGAIGTRLRGRALRAAAAASGGQGACALGLEWGFGLARRWWAAWLGQQARVLVGRCGARRADGARGGGSVGLLRRLGQAGHPRVSGPEAGGLGWADSVTWARCPFSFSTVFFSFSFSYFYPTLCYGFLTLEYICCQHVYLLVWSSRGHLRL